MVSTTNEGMQRVLGLLDQHEIGTDASVETSEPRSLVSPTNRRQLSDEGNEGSWPEMGALLRRDTNLTANYLTAMFFAGFVAAIGLLADMLHIVIGAMVIAPAFEPLIRVPFGLLGREPRAWKQAFSSTFWGYGVLMGGAAAAWPVMRLIKPEAIQLSTYPWVQYWSTVTLTAPILALAAGATGAAIIAAQRSVLTTGVMITLALVPSLAVTGLAIVDLDWELASRGLLRWAVDAAGVIVAGALVFHIKRLFARRRGAPGRVSTPV